MEKQWKQCQTLFFWAPKSLQMVIAAMKLRRLLLRRKVVTNLDSILKSGDITLPTKSIESVMSSNHLILCHPLLLLSSVFPSIRVFSNESVLHIRWQSIGVSASVSVLPMNIQDWFPLGLTDLISLLSKGLSRVFSNTTVQKHQFFSAKISL